MNQSEEDAEAPVRTPGRAIGLMCPLFSNLYDPFCIIRHSNTNEVYMFVNSKKFLCFLVCPQERRYC